MRTHTWSRLARAALALASGLVLSALAPLTAQAATSTYRVTSTIAVGASPAAVAVDATTNTVYVTNMNDSSVSVIDGVTGAVTSTITVGSHPHGVAVDATTNTVYVTNASATSCRIPSLVERASNHPAGRVAPRATCCDYARSQAHGASNEGGWRSSDARASRSGRAATLRS